MADESSLANLNYGFPSYFQSLSESHMFYASVIHVSHVELKELGVSRHNLNVVVIGEVRHSRMVLPHSLVAQKIYQEIIIITAELSQEHVASLLTGLN